MCFFDSPQTIHIFIFSFFSGNTIRFMFSGISYLRTYLVHLVQFSRSVVSDSLRPHEPQHARPPCLPPTPGVHPNSCPLSQWCHPTTSSSVVPFSSCFQSFPTSGSFAMSRCFTSVQFSSVDKSYPTLCDPMNHSTPGLPVHHQLLEFTQIHVHRVGDAIQPSHPPLFPFSPAPNPSQHQNLFQWVNSSHQVAKLLEFQFQHQSFQWIFRTDFL